MLKVLFSCLKGHFQIAKSSLFKALELQSDFASAQECLEACNKELERCATSCAMAFHFQVYYTPSMFKVVFSFCKDNFVVFFISQFFCFRVA